MEQQQLAADDTAPPQPTSSSTGVLFMRKARPSKMRSTKEEDDTATTATTTTTKATSIVGPSRNLAASGGSSSGGGGLVGGGFGAAASNKTLGASASSGLRSAIRRKMAAAAGVEGEGALQAVAASSRRRARGDNGDGDGDDDDDNDDGEGDGDGAAEEVTKHDLGRFTFASTRSGVAVRTTDGFHTSHSTDILPEDLALERNREAAKLLAQQDELDGKKLYRGAGAYKEYREKREVVDRKMAGVGPQRAPSHLRVTCMFDYKPDICKDYKETGYCTFGDSCKFMHDRGDYKSGWELEKEWEEEQQAKRQRLASGASKNVRELTGEPGEEEEEALPFACHICRLPFLNPVVTKCQHYFCEMCALKRYGTESKRCAVCNEQTHGVLNTATHLAQRIIKSGGNPYKREAGMGVGEGGEDGGGGEDGEGEE